MHIHWNLIFAFGFWTLWQHRNKVVFQKQSPNQTIHLEIIQRAVEYAFCAQRNSIKRPRVERGIQWERPYRCWFKLNTDGGGIHRSDSGAWIEAFFGNIGNTTSFLAELWALRDGLIMCLNLRVSALEVELDAQTIVELMNKDNISNTINSFLVVDCRLLNAQVPQIQGWRYIQSCPPPPKTF